MASPALGWIITLDGPAGSGKSTTARLVAGRLGFVYLDTGALYRALTVLGLKQGLQADDREALAQLAGRSELRITRNGEGQRVLAGSTDLTDRLRTPEVDGAVSAVSAIPEVRAAMLDLQRSQRQQPGLVAEGRDLGTVVFPDAHLKIYLVADLEVRTERRAAELRAAGKTADREALRAALARRDAYDRSRTAAPLRRAEDAVLVDTTQLTIEDQVERVVALFRDRFGA